MRILFLSGEHPSVPQRTGGIGSFVAGAGAALADAGHDVHLLVCAPGLPQRDVLEDGVHLHVRGLVAPARLLRGTGPRLLAASTSCRWHARQLGPFDVVESPEWEALGAAFAVARPAPLVMSLQTPSAVIRAHDTRSGAPSRSTDALERFVVRRADTVVSASQLLVDELRRTGWLPSAVAVDVAPPAFDPAPWAQVPPAANTEPVVLGIGRLEPRKGFDTLLDAVARIEGVPGLRVELVGGDTDLGGAGSWADHLAQQAQALGVELRLLGRVPRAQLPEVIAGARVVALPSTFDSFNMAGLEAMGAGRAVVVTDQVGLGEHVDGSPALTVVRAGSADELAAALDVHLRDPEAASRAGAAARRIASRLGNDGFIDHRTECYGRLVAQRTS